MSESLVYGDLADVGNTLKLREDIDPNQRATNFIRSSLSVVDIIPCGYRLSLAGLKTEKWGIEYEFENAMGQYRDSCAAYGLKEMSGVRLWVTDDTQASDEIGNFYGANIFESAVNKMSGAAQSFNQVKSMLESFAPGTSQEITDWVINETGLDKMSSKSNMAKTAADIVLLGKKIGLPKVWESSSYHPGLTLTAKLVSPYGDPEAIKKYIIEPLTYILLLAAPKSDDGISYGFPKPVRVQAYGMTYMNIASVDSVNIRRGGREVAHNIHKQPLALDVFLTLKPLLEGFASMTKNKPDVITVTESSKPFDIPPTSSPGITTVGNIIQSLRPAPTIITTPSTNFYGPIPPKPGNNGVPMSGVSAGISNAA